MSGRSHKTYPLLRYMPTYGGLPAGLIPPLILVSALLLGIFGLYGAVPALAATMALRGLYLWNPDALTILRGAIVALPSIDRYLRLRP